MSTAVARVDVAAWEGVRRRRGPDRVVVALALVLAVAMVAVGWTYRARGLYSPQLSSTSHESSWDEPTRSLTVRMDVDNTGSVPLSVTGGYVVTLGNGPAEDALFTHGQYAGLGPLPVSPLPITSSHVTPVEVPAGAQRVLTVRVGVDCRGYELWSQGTVVVVLTTTGTWPEHDVAVGELPEVAMQCQPQPTDG
ncbi:MAG: hypothetical protein U0R76_15490 [Candidatus Nanopelagicales bacterium]